MQEKGRVLFGEIWILQVEILVMAGYTVFYANYEMYKNIISR